MNLFKVAGIALASSGVAVGSTFAGQEIDRYIKDKVRLRRELNDCQLILNNIEKENEKVVSDLLNLNTALKYKLKAVKEGLEKGKSVIMNNIKKIQEMKTTLQGRNNLVHWSNKFIEEPMNKVAENFTNIGYLIDDK